MKKGVLKFLSGMLMLILAIQPINVFAATTIKCSYSLRVKVPNYKECSNFGTMCNNKNVVYAFKTKSGDDLTTMYKINNITDASPTVTVVKTFANQLGHANGSAYYSGHIYIPTKNSSGQPQIYKIGTDGSIVEKYTSKESTTISSITYFKSGYFIIGYSSGSGWSGNNKKYSLVKFNDSTRKIDIKANFYIKLNGYIEKGYDTFQDIYYSSYYEELLIPIWNSESRNENYIAVVSFSCTPNEIEEGEVIITDWKIPVNGKAGSKFEVESLIDTDTSDYFCINGDESYTDAVYEYTLLY